MCLVLTPPHTATPRTVRLLNAPALPDTLLG